MILRRDGVGNVGVVNCERLLIYVTNYERPMFRPPSENHKQKEGFAQEIVHSLPIVTLNCCWVCFLRIKQNGFEV